MKLVIGRETARSSKKIKRREVGLPLQVFLL